MRKNRKIHPVSVLLLCAILLTGSTAAAGCQKRDMETESEAGQPVEPREPETDAGNGWQKEEAALPEASEETTERGEAGPQPGLRTLRNFLLTAKEPLGNTMYIWGGGWNEADTAAGEEARSIGVSPGWAAFAAGQDAAYDYENTRYQIHDGLDCSGYVGWVLYNVFETENGKEGYVEKATGMAEHFAARGWGEYTPAGAVNDWKPGDIMSMKGHVWISLGTCEDGSVLLLHASPPGVILSGTLKEGETASQAVQLAEQYMQAWYPHWYERYPDAARPADYLTDSGRMRWNTETFPDAKQVQELAPEEILEEIICQ